MGVFLNGKKLLFDVIENITISKIIKYYCTSYIILVGF